MKIAITGHTAGIGQALAKFYSQQGHDIVGLSRREGNNIRNIPKIADQIEPCDVFVNNAQAGYAQTELLFEMAQRWTGTKKRIVVISTMMTQDPSERIARLRHGSVSFAKNLFRRSSATNTPQKTWYQNQYCATWIHCNTIWTNRAACGRC
jgi:NAD(P)-dependent dehydrogenase (short-subunit alcohol dehydrogenase family)